MVSTAAAALTSQIVTLPNIPELYDPNFLDILVPITRATESSVPSEVLPNNPMMDALKSTARQTFTENLAPAYDSTLSPTLDAFSLLSYYNNNTKFNSYLNGAWKEDPELTLRIIWNTRSIHDGKGDKILFYRAFGWLYENHPRTAISNLHLLVEPVCTTHKSKRAFPHGYWKDLLNILALATVGELSTPHTSEFLNAKREEYQYGRKEKKTGTPEERIQASLAKGKADKAAAKAKRMWVAAARYENLVRQLALPRYRALYIAVARLFADRLGKDLRILAELSNLAPNADRLPLLMQISLAGKWSPTPSGAHDRHTNIATAVSMLLHHLQTPPEYPAALSTPLGPLESSVILRSFYQRWILTPLRRVSEVPEPLMTANRWTEIKYNRVASVSMQNNTDRFFKHDPDGFQKYLMQVESGKEKISDATLLPHELVAQAYALGSRYVNDPKLAKYPAVVEFSNALAETKLRVVEAQWKTMIDRLRESGSLDGALAICDVSGSMGFLHARFDKNSPKPIFPSIALSLILAHLVKPPFDAGFITFSETPQFVQLDLTKPLAETITTMNQTGFGYNTDLNAVFLKLLLPLAVKNNVKHEDMIKRLFIFSDMQFDVSGGTSSDPANWETNYDAIEKAYKAAGYEVPQIVYWNLAHHETAEVRGDRKGVAMMNGFSPAMMKVFMGESEEGWELVGEDGEAMAIDEEFNPVNAMKMALSKKSYDGLTVVD